MKPEKVVEGFVKSLAERKDLDETKRRRSRESSRPRRPIPSGRASAITEAWPP